MAVPPRTSQAGTFFVTTVCAERRRVFHVDRNAQLLFDTLQHYRGMAYKLHAFVIMPEHLHGIITPIESLEKAMQCIKGGFSKRYHDEGGRLPVIWQKVFADHRLLDRVDFDRHVKYIAQNPVKRGIVADPADYQWSSAFREKLNLGG